MHRSALSAVVLAVLVAAAAAAAAAASPSRCILRPIPGPCKAAITKYYWDSLSGECKSFKWGGCKGQVPFNTLKECKEEKCNEKRCSFPGITGPCKASFKRYFYNPLKKKCESFTWGGCRGLVPFNTLSECEGKCEPKPVNPCKQKPDKGPCKGLFTRYYYNKKAKKCMKFIWGGCKGSAPFKTLAECQGRCQKNPCKLKPEVGPCKARIPKYFYDSASKSCKRFFWGGCKGLVPFQTLDECNGKCLNRRCKLRPVVGPCRARKPRYYYDFKTMSCKRFFWGGCRGVVPFTTLEQCEMKCNM